MPDRITNNVAIIISDLHIGDASRGGLDDFNQEARLDQLVLETIPQIAGGPATLILAGDIIDFPQVAPELALHTLGDRYGTTEDQSLERLNRVMAGHPEVFKTLKHFLWQGNQVLLLPGNHDIDFHWPKVLARLRAELGEPQEPYFHFIKEGFLQEKGLYVEHGNQHSYENRFDQWTSPILDAPDGKRLERPWGTLFMDTVYNDLESKYHFVDKVHPARRLLGIIMRSIVHGGDVTFHDVSKFIYFFLTKGKTLLSEQMLGAEFSEEQQAQALLASLRWELPGSEYEDALEEARKQLTVTDSGLLGGAVGVGLEQEELLGRTSEKGIRERAVELFQGRRAKIVVFGHTHGAYDGNEEPPFGEGDPRRLFNTGSWMPLIPIGEREKPRWGDLHHRELVHDLRYLVVRLDSPPTARLEGQGPITLCREQA